MRKNFNERQKGISLVSLVITIIVIIILSTMTFLSSNNSIKQTGVGIFVRELSLVRQAAHEKRLDNQVAGTSEENTYKGFYKTKVKNPPANFVSFSETELYAYVIDLEYVHTEDADRGHDYKKFRTNFDSNVVEFGVDDVYILDKEGNVFYVKGYETDTGIHYSNTGEEMNGPEIVSVNKTIAGDKKSATITVVVKKDSNGTLNTKVGGFVATRISTSEDGLTETFEAVVNENKTYVVMAEEIGKGKSTASIEVTELDLVTYVIRYIPNATDVVNMPDPQIKTEKVSTNLSNQIPERTGYTFLGWNENATAELGMYRPGGEFIKDGTVEGEFLNLYAIWKVGRERTYNVTYNANGGSNAPMSQENLSGDYVIESGVPTREGYSFLGWNTDSKAVSAKYVAGNKITLTENITLYAIWSKESYTITIRTNPEGAGTVTGNVEKVDGTEAFITTIAKPGYTFKNWSVISGGVNLKNVTSPLTSFIMPKSDVELVANYDVGEYTIKYNANRGTGEPRDQVKKHGEKIEITSAKPTRVGYDFLGWSLKENATDATYKAGDEYTVTQSVTFYAVWATHIEEYTLKFNLNGGYGNVNGEVGKFVDQTKKQGEQITIPKGGENEPYKEGFSFEGWALTPTSEDIVLKPGDKYSRDANMEVFAVWKDAIPPTITLAPKQEENSAEVKIVATAYDTGKIAEYAWTMSDTYPSAWQTNSAADVNLTVEKTIDQKGTHYFWAKDLAGKYSYQSMTAYEIKYDAMGGTNTPKTQYQLQNADLILTTQTPKKDRYTFLGWSIAANPGNTMSSVNFAKGAKLNLNADTVLRAVWGEVFFDLNPKTVVTQIDGPSVDVVVNKHEYTGNISVTSKNPEIASVTLTGNIITITPGTKIGDVEIVVTESTEGTTETIVVTVERGERQVTLDKTEQNFTYGDSSAQIQFSYNGKTTGVSATTSDSNVATAVASGKTLTITPKNYGTAVVGLVIAGDDQYNEKTVNVTVNVGKKQIIVTPNSNQSKVYDGSASTPELTYTDTGSIGSEKPEFDGKLERVIGSDVGQYEITIGSLRLVNNGAFLAANYQLVLSSTKVYFEITPKRIAFPVANTPQQYDGTPKEVVPAGTDYIRGGDYQKTNAGTYTATLALKDTKNFIWDDTELTSSRNMTWEIISTYYVKYNANNGSGTMENSTHKYGVEQSLTENIFTRDGYIFNGWNTKADGTGTSYADKAVVNNLTITNGGIVELYAQWKSINYTYNVVYESTSGVSLGSTTVTKAFGTTNEIIAQEIPGYETPESQNIVWDSEIAKTITFIYTPISYNVSFNLNGGTGVSDRTYTIETETFTLDTPSRTGYTFKGWTGANGTTLQVSVSVEKGSMGDKNFIANWYGVAAIYSESDNSLTFYKRVGIPAKDSTFNGNKVTAIYTGFETAEYGKSSEVPWNGLAENITSVVVADENIAPVSTAYWFNLFQNCGYFDVAKLDTSNATSICDTFSNAGTNTSTFEIVGLENWDTSNVTNMQGVFFSTGLSATSWKIGDISNWKTSRVTNMYGTFRRICANGNSTSPIELDLSGWDVSKVTDMGALFLDSKGLTSINLSGWDTSSAQSISFANCAKLEKITLGNNFKWPTKYQNGYPPDQSANIPGADGKWYDLATGIGYTPENVHKNTSREATYVAVMYNISYNLVGGTLANGTTNPVKYSKYSDNITLNNPTREGYEFIGWTGANGTTPQTVVTIEKGSTGNKSYTANWSAVSYNITINCNGGSGVSSTSYTIETPTFTLDTPTKSSYKFIGWTGSNGSEPQITVTIEKGSTGNKEYMANWEAVEYSISYNLNGGTVATENPTSYNVDTDSFTLNNPTREGLEFVGWTDGTGSDPQKTVTIAKGSSGNKTYTAVWYGAVAIYSADDTSLTFYKREGIPAAGSTYNGKAATAVYTGIETNTYERYLDNGWHVTTPWNSYATNITSVAFEDKITPVATACWFYGFTNCATMDLAKLETGSVTDMQFMFTDSKALTSVGDISGWDTGNVTDMCHMFSYCTSLTTLDLTGWDTSNVTDIDGMFYACKSLTELDLSGWDTSKVTNMESPFQSCTSLTELDLSGWDTSNVTDMRQMFFYSYNLKTIYVSDAWSTAAVTESPDMFGAGSYETPNPVRLVGGAGTPFNSSYTDKTYARIDGKDGLPGYLTNSITLAYEEVEAGGTVNPAVNIHSKVFSESSDRKYEIISGSEYASIDPDTGVITGKSSGTATVKVTVTAPSGTQISAQANVKVYVVEYNITYDLAGGSLANGVTNPVKYTIESNTFTLNNPTRVGYEFIGWTGSNGSEPQTTVKIEKGSIGNKEYTANWKIVDYTITYELNDGTVATANPTTYNLETETFTLNNPIKVGYTFAGWTGSNNTTPETSVSVEKGSTGNKTYTANWESNNFTYYVVYKSTSGLELGTTTVEKAFSTTNVVTAIDITGYNTPESQEIKWDTITPKTIIFTYNPISYNITINPNGGTGVSSTSYTIESETFTLGTPTKEGYTFAGWTDSNGTTHESVTIEKGSYGVRTYTAKWEAIEYNIELTLNGGIFNSILTQVEVGDYVNYSANGITSWRVFDIRDGEVLIIPANGPTSTKLTLSGADGYVNAVSKMEEACDAYTNSSLGITKDNVRSMTVEDLNKVAGYTGTKSSTRYAYYLFADSTYSSGTLTYNGNSYTKTKLSTVLQNGWTVPRFYTWDYAANVATDEKGIKYAYPTTGNPVYVSYDDYGYYYSPNNYTHIGNSNIKVGDLLGASYGWLPAQWIELNSGFVNFGFRVASASSLSAHGPIRSNGYIDSPSYGVYPLVSLDSGVQATRVSETSAWDLSIDNTETVNITYTIETPTFTLDIPTKKGYEFAGWTGDNGTTAQNSVSILKGTIGEKSYIANWNIVSYSITINPNGGTGVSSTSYTIESETFTLGTPTREYYRFTGWTDSNGVTYESVTIKKGSIGARNYTANWEWAAGLYDENDNLIASWDTLVNTYGMNVERDYTSSYAEGEENEDFYGNNPSAPLYVWINNSGLHEGKKLIIGNEVSYIGDYTLSGLGIENYIIPASVTSMGEGLYDSYTLSYIVDSNNNYYCSENGVLYTKNMTELVAYPSAREETYFEIPDSVTIIGDYAFSYCYALTSLDIPESVTRIEKSAFYECTGLKGELIIPDSVTYIGETAFGDCTGITGNLVIPDSVTNLGNHSFVRCSGITSVTIGNNVTTIYNATFGECTSLTSVTLGNKLETIGDWVFNECTALTNIIIPSSVTKIGYAAFYETGLTSVTFNNTSGWKVNTSETATTGTSVTVTNKSTAATYLKSTYAAYYWFK